MRLKIIVWLLALGLATNAVFAAKPDKSPAKFEADLGSKATPWGVLHSFDRMRAAKMVPPDYPRFARESNITGVAAYAVLVSEEGVIEDLKLLKSSGDESLDDAAAKALRQWKYRPISPRERFVTIQPISFELR